MLKTCKVGTAVKAQADLTIGQGHVHIGSGLSCRVTQSGGAV